LAPQPLSAQTSGVPHDERCERCIAMRHSMLLTNVESLLLAVVTGYTTIHFCFLRGAR
jgi:hypothetical protein